MELYLEGSKGGSEKSHTPVETPNNLLSVAYAKVLLAVAEGELAGTPTGRDIFLNGTPLISENGVPNFGGVTWDWRSGSVDQTYIQGMPEISNEITQGVEVRDNSPWVHQFTKPTLSAIRLTISWPALLQQKSNGDTVGLTIDYAVDISVNGGAYAQYQQYQVTGKTNTEYERTHRIDLPKGATTWTLRLRRITPNSESSLVQDTMNLKSYAEVVDAKQRYPNTALLFVQFDSRLFGGGQIPKISVKTKGRLVRVPVNYDPPTRTYSGIWNGTFKWAYTNNPAWVFMDIVTQNRFGLGNRVNTNQVDKWELYEVAQHCDVLVDDGTGSGAKQPRHTCNLYIQSKADAWTVLRDICGIFNGMTYWDGNQFVARADKQEPIDNIPLFGRSNVIGDFDYQTTDERTIFTSALVSYDEPDDHYNTQVEAVWEKSQILRWGGDRQASLSAIGCTVRAEAQRKGKYTLLTNMFNRGVIFKTGLQGLDPKVRPGAIIGIADPLIGGAEFTGRLVAATLKVLTLDRETDAVPGDKLFITRKDGSQEGRTIQAVAGKVITVTTNYSEIALPNSVWYLEAEELKSQLFKVTKMVVNGSTCELNAVEYNDSKYDAIDNGARLEPRPISKTPPQSQEAPSPITISSHTFTEQTMAVTTMTISWPKTPNAVLYEGQWRVGQGDWVTLGTTGATSFEVKGIYTGNYLARVRAINAMDIKSVWGMSETTALNGKDGVPPIVSSLVPTPMFFGIRLDWTFPPGAEDTLRTEFMYSETESYDNAIKLGDFAYPTDSHELHGLSAGKRLWFWCRLHDRTGNIGEWFPLKSQMGVMGQSLINDNGQYNDYFAGMISDTALDNALYDRIELIDGNGPGSVNDRIDTAVEDLQGQIDNITDALVYDPDKTYLSGDIVRLNNKLYQAQTDVPLNTPPPNELYWKDVGIILEDANGLASRVDVVEADIAVIDGVLTSTVTSLESMQAAYRDDDGVGAQDDAVAGWNSRAQINTEREVRASADEAFASELVTFKAEVDTNTASITSLTQVVADNESATATRLDQLEVTVNEDIAAAISNEATVRANADLALATQIETVEANMMTDVQVNALIQVETSARVTADEALATQITTVEASVGENSAAIEETSTAVADIDGKVSTAWTLKMELNSNGQYVAAGIGLGIENGPAGLQSQFLVRADRFAIVNGINTTTAAPFVVQGGQVFISQALIGTGWITNAMIGDTIQSNNFVANSTGWRLNKAGTLEFNGNIAGLGRLTINNNTVQVYDSAGTLRVRLGMW